MRKGNESMTVFFLQVSTVLNWLITYIFILTDTVTHSGRNPSINHKRKVLHNTRPWAVQEDIQVNIFTGYSWAKLFHHHSHSTQPGWSLEAVENLSTSSDWISPFKKGSILFTSHCAQVLNNTNTFVSHCTCLFMLNLYFLKYKSFYLIDNTKEFKLSERQFLFSVDTYSKLKIKVSWAVVMVCVCVCHNLWHLWWK